MQRISFFSIDHFRDLYQNISNRLSSTVEAWQTSSPESSTGKKCNQQRLDDISFPADDIPEEYIDTIHLYHIMDEPVILDGRHITDLINLQTWWAQINKSNINPLTNEVCTSIKPLPNLKIKIETFVKNKETEAENVKNIISAQIKARTLQLEAKNIKRKNKMKECADLRDELLIQLTNFLEQLEDRDPDAGDEEKLNEFLIRIDELDKKIKKVSLGDDFKRNPAILKEYIDDLIHKKNKSEDDEKKLDRLIKRLSCLKHPFGIINRGSPYLFNRRSGLLAILETQQDDENLSSIKSYDEI